MDPVKQIRLFNSERDPALLAFKYDKLRTSIFAFFRGTCHLFYSRIHQEVTFPHTPLVWSCGDLHLENFGSYKADNRQVYFDINDFDESALAPAAWDLVRMLSSILLATDGLHKKTSDKMELEATFLDAYALTLATGKPYWVERETATGSIKVLLDKVRERTREQFLNSRTDIKGKRRQIRLDGKKALSVTPTQRDKIAEFMSTFAKSQSNPGFYAAVDVARRIAGTGSLGLDRYVILVEGKGSPNGNYLLDLKYSNPSTLAAHFKQKQPAWPSEAHRIVELQQRSQAVPMAFLQPVKVANDAYVLRGLQPVEDRIAFTPPSLAMPEFRQLLVSMGQITAWAHLRGSGRQGSAKADALIEFGKDGACRQELLALSQNCAEQVQQDAARFNEAFDQGEFNGR